MSAPDGGASREMVLAWMQEMGKGYKAAAAHFRLPVERVKMWERRASPRPPGASPQVAKVADDPKVSAAKPGAAPVARGKDGLDVAAMHPKMVAGLQLAAYRRVLWLAKPESVVDKDQVKVAAALKMIVESAPGAIQTLGAQATEADSDQLLRDLATAMGIDPDAPPVLRQIPGGKAASG